MIRKDSKKSRIWIKIHKRLLDKPRKRKEISIFVDKIDNDMEQYIDSIINEHQLEGRKKLLELIESGNKDLVFSRLIEHANNHHTPVLFYDVIAWLYNECGEKDKALEYLQMMYKMSPIKEVLYQIFNVYFSAERYEEALDVANKYIELYDGGKILRTKTLLRMSTPKEQLRIIDEGLDEIDTYKNKFAEETLAYKAAEICYDLKQYKRALSYLERAESALQVGTGEHIKKLKDKIQKKKRMRKLIYAVGISILTLILLFVAALLYVEYTGPVTDCDSCLNGTTP